MTISVVSVQSALLGCARAFLPPTSVVITGGKRAYFVYRTATGGPDQTFTDLDGEPLTECRFFESADAAQQWIDADIAKRRAA
jgi:hypothetical protein